MVLPTTIAEAKQSIPHCQILDQHISSAPAPKLTRYTHVQYLEGILLDNIAKVTVLQAISQ